MHKKNKEHLHNAVLCEIALVHFFKQKENISPTRQTVSAKSDVNNVKLHPVS